MKKLLIASDSFLPRWDGIARFLVEILPKLEEHYKITILAPKFEGKTPTLPGIEIVHFPLSNIKVADYELPKAKKKEILPYVKDADIIFSQTLGPIGRAVIHLGNKYHKHNIAFIHSIEWELAMQSISKFKYLIDLFMRKYARSLYNKCDLLIIPHEEVYYKFRKNKIETKTEIVHLGTNTTKFLPTEDKRQAKQLLGINPDHKIIGYHGRIGKEKDLKTLYRAFRRIEKKMEGVKLLIVGPGNHQNYFKSSRNIILPGPQNNVIPYLQAMDVYVLPSLTETTSLSTMEAMSCALPVIVTPVGFMKQYITEKKNGMFFPEKNSLVLSMKLERVLKNPVLAKSMGENARKTIVETFSWKHAAEKIHQLLAKF